MYLETRNDRWGYFLLKEDVGDTTTDYDCGKYPDKLFDDSS